MSDSLPQPKLDVLVPVLGPLAGRVAEHGELDDDGCRIGHIAPAELR
jgi:hypothetical protein